MSGICPGGSECVSPGEPHMAGLGCGLWNGLYTKGLLAGAPYCPRDWPPWEGKASHPGSARSQGSGHRNKKTGLEPGQPSPSAAGGTAEGGSQPSAGHWPPAPGDGSRTDQSSQCSGPACTGPQVSTPARFTEASTCYVSTLL